MGSPWEIYDTLDRLIEKLEAMRKKRGGDTWITLARPTVVDVPYERDRLDEGLKLIERESKIIIDG
jgi:hypothetical protein